MLKNKFIYYVTDQRIERIDQAYFQFFSLDFLRIPVIFHPMTLQVEKLEDRLEAAQADQKNLFLIIFQRFIMILSEHLVRCDTDAVDFKTPWFMWTVGRLHQIFMIHHEQV